MGIPDDETLRSKLRGILQGANLETLTKRAARRELEKSFSLEEGGLDERKQEIASWVDEYIEENDKNADEPPAAESAERSASEADEDEDGDDSKESTAKSAKKGKSARGWKPQWLKPALAEFVGTDQMKRTDVVKMIWDHVRSNNLQDPSNRQYFIADDKLFKLFGKKRIHCFKMNKDLSKLIHPADPGAGPKRGRAKEEEDEDEEDEDDDEDEEAEAPKASKGTRGRPAAEAKAKPKAKAKGKGGGFQAEVRLSAELADLLGAESMPRTQIVKHLWAYIKDKDLQDPKNKSRILPDAKMRPVFGKAAFTGFSMMKLLQPHIIKD